jgi:hypothetical protein
VNAVERGAELGERGMGRSSIFRIRFYEKIEVVGKAGLRMEDNGVSSHNEVLNAMGMECGQKIFVILEHPAPSSSL